MKIFIAFILSLVFISSNAADKKLEVEQICTNFASKKQVKERQAFTEQCIKRMMEPSPSHVPSSSINSITEAQCKSLYGKDSDLRQSLNNSYFAKQCRAQGFIL